MELNRDILRKLPRSLRIEIEENARRKSLTQSELAAEQQRILAELRKHKTPGKRTDLKGGRATSGKDLPQVHATAVVGKLYGESRTQVEKRAAVVEAAKTEPERFGKLKEAMDKTGRVNGPFRRLKNIRQTDAIRSEPPPLPNQGPYRVAVCDVPWPYEPDDPEPAHRGAWPFPTMSLSELCALGVGKFMHDDAIMWFWVTNFHLRHAFTVLDAWGFHQTPTMLTWAKDRMGNGHWLRGQTEHCIFATRGKPVVTLTDQTTLLHAPVRGHSVKPVEFYELVEKLCPAPRYADLFSRYRHNDKWDCHGDEAPPTSDSGTPTKEAALRATIGPDLAIPGFLQRPKVGAS
jgi:N6-adenosine-specific RNA methylase IME4